MAIYHQAAKILRRSAGQSAVAAAAYRSGSILQDHATGLLFDYTRKPGVEHSEIMAPDGAPAWVFDREQLWNTVEASEHRRDAQLAREIVVALPIELSTRQQIALLREFVRQEFVCRGMVADFSLHLDNPENPHAHILLTTRTLTATGFGQKNRAWNQTTELVQWRRNWAATTNTHLAAAGSQLRIDERSYAESGLF
jgi:ATP-dependent exoDNAse (exonuclease V) alpha subunit